MVANVFYLTMTFGYLYLFLMLILVAQIVFSRPGSQQSAARTPVPSFRQSAVSRAQTSPAR